MTVTIHPTAVIGADVELGEGTTVGAYAIVESGAVVGRDNELGPGCYLFAAARLGDGNRLMRGASLGGEPQDLKYKGEPTRLVVGDRNWIGENATIHRGTPNSGETVVGDENFLMSNIHVGHDCRLGNNNVMSSGAILGGGTHLHNGVILGGNAGVHQFCRLGDMAMIGGLIRVRQDVLPYTLVGSDNALTGLNRVGLRRAGHGRESVARLREAYRRFCIRREPLQSMLAWLAENKGDPLLDQWHEFISGYGKRGFIRERAKSHRNPDEEG